MTTLDGRTVTVNPGEPGYLDAFSGIVPISKVKNNLEMTNKSDRPTIIFTDVGVPVSSTPSINAGGGRSGDLVLKPSNDSVTMKKIQTLILET